jgi:hypothetical protein
MMCAMRGVTLLLAASLAAMACSSEQVVPPAGENTQGTKAALVLPFVEDDYARALAEAKAKAVPLFVEAWAPW